MPTASPQIKSTTITVTLDDKTFPMTVVCRQNERGQWKFYASVTAHGQISESIEVGDDQDVTIWDAARLWNLVSPHHKIEIPGLCHRPELGYQATGVCRLCSVCVVDEKGRPGKQYAAACMRSCKDGMVVLADDHCKDKDPAIAKARERMREARRTLIELLLAEHPTPCAKELEEPGTCELEAYGRRYGLLKDEYRKREEAWVKPTSFLPRVASFIPPPDNSNFSIAIDHAACILCDRCVRACSHVDVDQRVIGRTGKGAWTRIGFDNDLPMKESSCVNCGWCMVSCPTGAITYSGLNIPMQSPWEEGVPLDAESMRDLEIVKGGKISLEFLKRSENGVVVKRFNKGDVICRQGEYGRTAFYINSGKVDVFVNLRTPPKREPPNLLKRIFFRGSNDVAANPVRTKPIPVAPEVELDASRPVATLGEGTLFGEEACLNNQARSATIEVAEDGTEIVIMFRNFLDVLTRNRAFRAKLEDKYRRWAIENHLRNSRYMQGVGADFREKLRERTTLVRFQPGETIFAEGDSPDAFYMIRLGHVRVMRRPVRGEEFTIRYMTAGEVFGEIGALFGVKRTATCQALDNVQLVKIARDDFADLIEAYPDIRRRLEEKAIELVTNDGSKVIRDPKTNRVLDIITAPFISHTLDERRTPSLTEYLDQQLYQGQHMLVLDLEKCTRCDECVTACGQSHVGITRLLEHGKATRDKEVPITRLIRDGLRYENYLVTTSCRSCRDPKCLVGCPVDAIHRKGTLPIVIENHCVGCGRCAENCPFGNITLHPVPVTNARTGEVQTGLQAAVCNLDNCIDEDREPSCVYACPHDAAHRVDGQKFFGLDVLGPKEPAV
jgi:CRP-like cAMP-binding protein/Fe-S-cluster-containing hydrogenase component 2